MSTPRVIMGGSLPREYVSPYPEELTTMVLKEEINWIKGVPYCSLDGQKMLVFHNPDRIICPNKSKHESITRLTKGGKPGGRKTR